MLATCAGHMCCAHGCEYSCCKPRNKSALRGLAIIGPDMHDIYSMHTCLYSIHTKNTYQNIFQNTQHVAPLLAGIECILNLLTLADTSNDEMGKTSVKMTFYLFRPITENKC